MDMADSASILMLASRMSIGSARSRLVSSSTIYVAFQPASILPTLSL
jgi:hypothetical protein